MAVCGPFMGRIFCLRTWVILALLPLFAGCQSMLPQTKPPLTDEGEVLLYVEPSPRKPTGSGSIGEIVAKKADGGEYPIALKLTELRGREMKRQRFWGRPSCPPASMMVSRSK